MIHGSKLGFSAVLFVPELCIAAGEASVACLLTSHPTRKGLVAECLTR